jgi:DNA-binding MarR family transcriptional regulator
MHATQGKSNYISTPALIGAAQRTYVSEIRNALAKRGYDDMPRTAYRIVSALAESEASVQDLASRLAISKQAASRLVETLVQRGYCERRPDLKDRRRMLLLLTRRGRSAAQEVRTAVKAVDALLTRHVGKHDVGTTRATLGALTVIGRKELPDRSASRVRM